MKTKNDFNKTDIFIFSMIQTSLNHKLRELGIKTTQDQRREIAKFLETAYIEGNRRGIEAGKTS